MKLLATLAVLAIGTISSASADIISYNTGGSGFTSLGGMIVTGNSFTITDGGSSATVTYTEIAPGTTVNDAAPGTNLSYGRFVTSFSGVDTLISIPVFTFVLDINNTTAGASGIFSASSAGGTISRDSNSVTVTYVPSSMILGTTNFSIFSPTPLVPSTTLAGAASIQGTAVGVSTNTPEPASMFLLGAGLIGVGFSARKRFSRRS